MTRQRERYHVVQIESGKWYALGSFTHDECCDCALVHRTEYKFEKGRVFVRYAVDYRRTAARRKELGIRITRTRKIRLHK